MRVYLGWLAACLPACLPASLSLSPSCQEVAIWALTRTRTQVRKSLRPETPGKCLPDDKTFYGLAAITIFFDVVIFLLPIPLLLRVQITTPRKVALIGLFVLGLFTTVCSVLRMIQIIIISKNGNSTMLVLWGAIEMNVGVWLLSLSLPPSLSPSQRTTHVTLVHF